MSNDISAKVKTFLWRHINSVWELELLLHLKNAGRPLQLREVSRALYLEARLLDATILRWVREGILEQCKEDASGVVSFTYAPGSGTLAEAIDETAQTYMQRRTALVALIYSTPLRDLAEAFNACSDEAD